MRKSRSCFISLRKRLLRRRALCRYAAKLLTLGKDISFYPLAKSQLCRYAAKLLTLGKEISFFPLA